METINAPIHPLVKLRACEHCVHWWIRKTATGTELPAACGKRDVQQYAPSIARGPNGDCGPRGKYFQLNPKYLTTKE